METLFDSPTLHPDHWPTVRRLHVQQSIKRKVKKWQVTTLENWIIMLLLRHLLPWRKKNLSADAFSRVCGATVQYHANKSVSQLHNDLCHPGIQRMLHFVRSKNLPFSTEEVRQACNKCRSCAELKPRYYKPGLGIVVKARTSPFERISIDFVGPKPSSSRNKFLLTVVDEYSRFPFAFPTPDTSSRSVIKCLAELFSIFGQPSYVHSDRGSHFM